MDWPEWSATNITERPGVRVNQLGYLTGRPKEATLISDAEEPIHFTVRNRNGAAVHTGTQPWSVRPEPTSGLRPCSDFRYNTRGADFRIEADDQCSHPFEVTSSLYAMLAADALRFFYAMRSGRSGRVMPGYGRPGPPRAAAESAAIWRCPRGPGPKRSSCTRGGGAMAFDVSGGWYDAGDYGKYVTSGAIAVCGCSARSIC